MKYLINRTTKQHVIATAGHRDRFSAQWDIVDADPEGWIAHTGTECPLPDDCRVSVLFSDGTSNAAEEASYWGWCDSALTHYRPILDDMARPTKSITEMIKNSGAESTPCMDVLTRLSIAHKTASGIPDLVEQLRAQLEPLGLGVMYLSQFDEVE